MTTSDVVVVWRLVWDVVWMVWMVVVNQLMAWRTVTLAMSTGEKQQKPVI